MVGFGEGSKLLMGEDRKESLPILPNTFCNIPDHDFAAVDTVRAIGAPGRGQLRKAGGS